MLSNPIYFGNGKKKRLCVKGSVRVCEYEIKERRLYAFRTRLNVCVFYIVEEHNSYAYYHMNCVLAFCVIIL